jgi:pimeloyl-ACP methyl ester carboxylesterase
MKSKIFRIILVAMVIVLILAVGMFIAGAVAKSNMAKHNPAPGQLVDVGGFKMHINCVGQGSPTVILAAGTADFSTTWAYVQPEIAKLTRVCSYDRAGLGWSEPSPYPRTVDRTVEELHTLLVNAGVQGPYVLVGHSLGGMHLRVYTYKYPQEVVGLIQVDSLHEDQPVYDSEYTKVNQDDAKQFHLFSLLSSTGIMALAPQSIPNLGLPNDAYAQWQASLATSDYFKTTLAEINAQEDNCAEVRALNITSFGNMPLIVLSAGQPDPVISLSDAGNQKRWEVWQALQPELAALSSTGNQIIAEQSSHMLQLIQPDLVIETIREMVDAIRK